MIYKYRRLVKYYETDKMGVVHHSNYIRWFEEARVEFMREADISYRSMEEEGVMVPVVTVDCKYKIPATFDDEVIIYTKVRKYNGIVIELEYEVKRVSDDAVIVTGSSSHCFVDSNNFKPVNLKRTREDIHNKFMAILEVEQ